MPLSSTEPVIQAHQARIERLPSLDPHDLSNQTLNRVLISIGPTIKVLHKSLLDLISRPFSDPESLARFINATLGKGDKEGFISGFRELVDRRSAEAAHDMGVAALSINRLTPLTWRLLEMAISRHPAFSQLSGEILDTVVSTFIHESAILLPSFMLRPSQSRSSLLLTISHERGHTQLSTDQAMLSSRLDDLWSVTEKYLDRLFLVLGHKKPDARLDAVMSGLAILKSEYPVLTGCELFLQAADGISTFRSELPTKWAKPDLAAVAENVLRDTIELCRDHIPHLQEPLDRCAAEVFSLRRKCDIAAINDLKELQEAKLVSPSRRIVMAHNNVVAEHAKRIGFAPLIRRVPTLGRQLRAMERVV